MRVRRISLHVGRGLIALVVSGCSCGLPVGPVLPGVTDPPTPSLVVPATPTVLTSLPTAPPTVTAAPTAQSVSSGTVTSDDGMLTIEIPEGALSEPVAITATALDDGDSPVVKSLFGYELRPDGLIFDAPVRITRTVPDKGGQHEPIPAVALASRSADGFWEWLNNQLLVQSIDENSFSIAGETTRLGDIFGVVDGVMNSSYVSQPNFIAPVGQDFYVSSSLFSELGDVPATIDNITAFTEGATPIVTPGLTQTFGSTAYFQQLFECSDTGMQRIGVEYTTAGIPNDPDGIGPSTVTTQITAQINCIASSTAPVVDGACVAVSNQPLGDFPQRLVGDFTFDGLPDDADVTVFNVGIIGANGNSPAQAFEKSPGSWQANLGYDPDQQPSDMQVFFGEAVTSDGVAHDITQDVRDAVGPFPGDFGPGKPAGNDC